MRDFELDENGYSFQKFPTAYVQKALSEGVDWTLDPRGVVTSVKDQAQHGYCGTFARLAAAEGQYAIHSGHPARNFSVEQMVDCVGAYQAQHDSIAAVKGTKYPGLMAWEDYPYDSSNYKEFDPPSKTHPCQYDASKVVPDYATNITGTVSVSGQSEDQAAAFIHHNGPITCGINSEVLYLYDKNFFVDEDACAYMSTDIDHSVTCVGFGVDAEKGPYWKIKNSWADDWADGGFVRVARGVKCAGLGTSFGWIPVYGDIAGYFETSEEVVV